MIIVTGGAGFIGSRLILGLNRLGYKDILVIDDLTDGRKFKNLAQTKIMDYIDYEKFLNMVESNTLAFPKIEVVFHQGACSKTTEWNGRYMMNNNFEYSKKLLHHCLSHHIPFIYASSAAIYGDSTTFQENSEFEKPLNLYGYSKFLFDQYVRRQLSETNSPVIGLRYFNVYGPHEDFKGSMSSVVWHLMNQLKDNEEMKLFEGSNGYQPGEQKRDFIFVDDIVKINTWFLNNLKKSGIYNCGTGKARTFNSIAYILLKLHGKGKVKYIPFPKHLKNYYQSFTQADISKLRSVGFSNSFTSLEEGIKLYYQYFLDNNQISKLTLTDK